MSLADTLTAFTRPDSVPMLGIYISLAGLLLALSGLLWAGGRAVGRLEERQAAMKESYDRELRDLKKSIEQQDQHAITREEIDARFGEVRALIEALRDRIGDVVRICTEAIKR